MGQWFSCITTEHKKYKEISLYEPCNENVVFMNYDSITTSNISFPLSLNKWEKTLCKENIYMESSRWVYLPNNTKMMCQYNAYIGISGAENVMNHNNGYRIFGGISRENGKCIQIDNFINFLQWIDDNPMRTDVIGTKYRELLKIETKKHNILSDTGE